MELKAEIFQKGKFRNRRLAMFYDILDKKRQNLLPCLEFFKERFYLASGTGLALQIGHRDSKDFDFFSPEDFQTQRFFEEIKENIKGFSITKIQEERNTLSVLADDIKLSFFAYKYPLLEPLIEEKYLRIASVADIGCMKLSAIISRATNKDYIDLYFILQRIKLEDLLKKAEKKFPDIDTALILKSLVYFEDIENEEIVFKKERVDFENVKKFLIAEVKQLRFTT